MKKNILKKAAISFFISVLLIISFVCYINIVSNQNKDIDSGPYYFSSVDSETGVKTMIYVTAFEWYLFFIILIMGGIGGIISGFILIVSLISKGFLKKKW